MKKIVIVLLTGLAISCGNNKKDEKPSLTIGNQQEQTSPAITKVNPTDDKVAEVTIVGNDQMKYDKNTIRVKAGQKVKLTLKHSGTMEKSVMGHNWVLLTEGTDMAAVGQASATAADTDYIPASMKNKIIAHTKMLGGGESDTIEFDAPAPGTYTFMCTFPGHYVVMNGKFIVE